MRPLLTRVYFSGVAAFMKPPQWLKNGDVVEIEIERIGKIANKMVFEA